MQRNNSLGPPCVKQYGLQIGFLSLTGLKIDFDRKVLKIDHIVVWRGIT